MEIVQVFVSQNTLERVRAVLEPMNLTPEEVMVQFYQFCAEPDNLPALKKMLAAWMANEEPADI